MTDDQLQSLKDKAAAMPIRRPPEEVSQIALLLRSLADGMEAGGRYDSVRVVRMLRQWAEILDTADYE